MGNFRQCYKKKPQDFPARAFRSGAKKTCDARLVGAVHKFRHVRREECGGGQASGENVTRQGLKYSVKVGKTCVTEERKILVEKWPRHA